VRATIADSANEEEGLFSGYIGTFPDKFKEVKEGFLKEFNRIRDEAPSKEEVEDAKKYLTGSLAFKMTTCAGAAKLLQAVDRFQLGVTYLDDYRQAVTQVTPADVQAVAKKYLDPQRLTLVAAGAIDQEGKPLPKKD
jgi:zinc protease